MINDFNKKKGTIILFCENLHHCANSLTRVGYVTHLGQGHLHRCQRGYKIVYSVCAHVAYAHRLAAKFSEAARYHYAVLLEHYVSHPSVVHALSHLGYRERVGLVAIGREAAPPQALDAGLEGLAELFVAYPPCL